MTDEGLFDTINFRFIKYAIDILLYIIIRLIYINLIY